MEYYLSLITKPKVNHPPKNHYLRQKYFLGKHFPNIYLTQREAECIAGLLQHGTMKTIARNLNISHRTVEYYIQNVKAKIQCYTKADLIKHIKKSDFAMNYQMFQKTLSEQKPTTDNKSSHKANNISD